MNLRRIRKNSALLLCLVLAFGCRQKKEGCLDASALNFDVSADKDCCCIYPSIVLKTNFKKDDTTGYNFFNGYQKDAKDKVYLVKSIRFYISGLEVRDADGWFDSKGKTTRWIYDVTPKEEQISDNVWLVSSQNVSDKGHAFESFNDPGLKTGARLVLGLSNKQNAIIPDSLQEPGPLAFTPDSLWAGPQKYIQQEWIVVTDTANATYTIDTFQVIEAIGGIEFDYETYVQKGENFEIKMNVLVPKWLEGVSWAAEKPVILQKLLENGASAVSLVQ